MKNLAPYQLFFPLGLLNAMIAVGVWFVQNLGWFSTPSLLIHSKLIIGGFLWSFIVGFLMTAVPRMTGTSNANTLEYIVSATLLFGLTLFSWWIDGRYFYGTQALLVVFVMIYAGRRIARMTKPLPVFFSHVGIAMLLALAGCYYHFRGFPLMGIHLFHVGTVLLLVLGIGTRFFSFLSGLPSTFEVDDRTTPRILFHISGLVMALLLFFAGQGYEWAYFGLFALSCFYLLRIWKIQRPSNRPSALKHSARVVAACIPLSFFMLWLQPAYYITWFHILFIGTFGLITLAVATRVTLAHGSYSTDLEMSTRSLWWLFAFLVLGTLSRVLYGFSDGLWKTSYLHLAATFWIGAVICWCSSFLPKIFKPGPQAKPSC